MLFTVHLSTGYHSRPLIWSSFFSIGLYLGGKASVLPLAKSSFDRRLRHTYAVPDPVEWVFLYQGKNYPVAYLSCFCGLPDLSLLLGISVHSLFRRMYRTVDSGTRLMFFAFSLTRLFGFFGWFFFFFSQLMVCFTGTDRSLDFALRVNSSRFQTQMPHSKPILDLVS